ncbi:MAG TPA: sugar kinase [Thermomicrobiales bacterium]|nr:sugar kinase [Thermomicrobiales bacterium]
MVNAGNNGFQAPDTVSNRRRRVVTFGEAMLRLTPPGYERLERATSLEVTAGGAELNTAVALRCLGFDATWVSVLPDTGAGRLIDRLARSHGVDTSTIRWVSEDEGRTGLYFLEEGLDPRPSAVTYDRKDSAIARMAVGAFDWPALLAETAVFHVSGITLALSPAVRAETMEAVRVANQLGVTVSFDLNYRSKLWSEAEAREAFVEIIPRVDVLFASREALRTFYGIEGPSEEVLRNAIRKLGVAAVTITRKRAKGSRRLKLVAMAMGKNGVLSSSEPRDIEVLDRLGGGDAYAAGFLAAYIENPGALTRAVSLGVAASALKHTMRGDFLCATRAEIEAALQGGREGVLQR